MAHLSALDDLFDYGKSFLEGQIAYMESPSDDWNSYALGTTGELDDEGARVFHSVELDVPEEERDDVYGVVVPSMIRDTASTMVLVVVKTFAMLPGGASGPEKLAVFAADAARKRFATASVRRSADAPPAIEAWIDASEDFVFGRLLEPIRLALLERAASS